MSTIVLRSVKGSPLTNTEVDTNFSNLNTDKTELGGTYSAGTANGVLFLSSSKVLTSGSALTFDGTNLGVGTASPSRRLDSTTSNNSATDTQLALRNTFPGNGVSAGIAFGFNTITADPDFLAAVYGIVTDRSARNGVLTFNTASSGTLSEQMRLTSTGLGIGTSSPGAKLDVNSSEATTLALRRDGGTDANTAIRFQGASSSYYIGRNTAGGLGFSYNAPDVTGEADMTLDSSGNLGLGVTPSAWNGSFSAFQMKGGGYAAMSISGTAYHLNNAYFNSSNSWIYYANGNATRYEQGSGAHSWFTAPSGTAGNAISFSQVMTLDASGNLGVGETSPTSRLHVAFTSNSVDAILRVQQKGNNTAAGITLSANDNNGAGYNFIQSETTGGTAHWKISGGVATSTMAFSTGGTERARIDSSGNLLIGTDIPAGTTGSVGVRKGSTGELILLANNGGLYHQAVADYYLVTTAGGNTSDVTLKKNVQQLSGALAKVCAIRGVNFEFIAEQKSTPDNGVQVGVIAQEVEAQYPEIVVTNEDGIKSVRYDRLVAPLIEAIKELKAEFDAYKASHP
jgi:hypothetical protein